uniref:Endonuclease/exonuclease/phosphatase domain-containing protein n=1 Tax=Daphnia galeata TaxID=27404 RepID=A0A8J2WGY9_9CRUS|nr:unnamed protein product [Daphnia galeata]
MASCDSSDNPNKIKIAGIGEGYLKKLKEKYKISDHYDILERFKSFEDEIWGDGGPDTETSAFIDKLLSIIHDKIRYPKLLGHDDGLETKNANDLLNSLKELIEGIESSKNNKTMGETVKELKTKSGNGELFDTFLCCLLMSEPEENKTIFFGGVFKSWGWLQQLDQVEVKKLKKFFDDENTKKLINREGRTVQVKLGFQKIQNLINNEANRNLLMEKLDSTSQKEEAIQENFYKWIGISNKKHFNNCYVSLKCDYLPNFDKYTDLNNNFINHLQWEIQEIQESFHFLNLLPPTSATENIVSSLQKPLVDLWKQVKDNVNDVKKWNRLVLKNSNKGTLQRNEVPCRLDKLKCLQINLNRSEKAWNRVVDNWLKDDRVHIVFIQEPCIKKMEITRQDVKETNKKNYCYYFRNLPTNYRAIHNTYLIDQELANAGIFISAILVHQDVSFERILPMAAFHDQYNYPQELMAGIRLTGQGWNGVTLFSIYCRPIRSLTMVLKPLLFDNHDITRTVLCMDANATHPNWSPAHENTGLYSGRGEDLEYFRTSCKLKVANQNFKNVKKENNQPTRDDAENKPEPKPQHIDCVIGKEDRDHIASLDDFSHGVHHRFNESV